MNQVAQEQAHIIAPHNLDAEQALLGAIFINNEAYHHVASFLRPEHFYEQAHADIYDACAKVIGSGRTASPVSLKSYFTGDLTEDISWAQYLARLAAEATTVLNAPDYARVILENAQRRELMLVGDQIMIDAANAEVGRSPKDIIEDAEMALFGMAETGRDRRGVQGFDQAVVGAIDMAAAAYKREGGLSGLPTGLSDLDALMGGLQDSDLVILAARPGMGKTAMATNIAYHLASNYNSEADSGARVLFFSLEMSSDQLATRVISDQAGVSSTRIRRGKISESQFEKLVDVSREIKSIPLMIDDQGGQKVGRIVSTARRAKRQKGVDLIVVDYLQLLSGTTKRSGENRVQEITEITTKLKGLAKELCVPVLALSQLSRQVENRDNKRPQLSDLRDSGSIEQDADVVIFLYREEYYLNNKEPKPGTDKHLEWQAEMAAAHGVAEVIVGKQRHGPTGVVKVHFDANLTKFTNLSMGEQSQGEML